MIRAGRWEDVERESGEWCFVDLGFARASKSCGILMSDGEPKELTFAELVSQVALAADMRASRPLCLLLEAPLSVAFSSSGNPTGRAPEKRGSETRYWYAGLGTVVLTAATYLLRSVVERQPSREVLLFEGFASFKIKSAPASHSLDVTRLREAVWSGHLFPHVLRPDALRVSDTDSIVSAFKVAGMDFGVPPVVVVDG